MKDQWTETLRRKEKADEDRYFAEQDRKLIEKLHRQHQPAQEADTASQRSQRSLDERSLRSAIQVHANAIAPCAGFSAARRPSPTTGRFIEQSVAIALPKCYISSTFRFCAGVPA